MANFNKRFFGMVVLSLILFTGIFLIKDNFALAYSNNFDSYSNGYKINLVSEWASSTNGCIVSNSYYSSSPFSLKMHTNNNGCVYTSNSKITNVIFSINDIYNIYNGGYIGFNDINNNPMAKIGIDEYYPAQNIKLEKDGTSKTLATTTYGTWYNVYIDFLENEIRAKVGLGDWQTISTTTNDIYIIIGTANSSNPDSNGIFLDDITITTSTTSPVDAINLTNPEEASIQNKNIFYWAYNFTISSSSYAAYDSFDTQIEYIPPIAGATSTFIESNWYKPAVQPETAYIIIYDEAYNIPLYLGNYTAGAYLIGLKNNSFDILASDFVNFTMSEGTTTAQTAWCSGLCNDLATTTSSWWPPLVCAGRYVICYAMYPHDLTKQMFWQAYNDFKLVFPFNIFFEITSTIDNVFASTTMASTTGSFGLPMIRKVGTTSQYYILPLLTSTTTANFLGNSNANLLRFSLSSIIYAFYTVGIILILW